MYEKTKSKKEFLLHNVAKTEKEKDHRALAMTLPKEYKKQALVLLQGTTELAFTGELYYSYDIEKTN